MEMPRDDMNETDPTDGWPTVAEIYRISVRLERKVNTLQKDVYNNGIADEISELNEKVETIQESVAEQETRREATSGLLTGLKDWLYLGMFAVSVAATILTFIYGIWGG